MPASPKKKSTERQLAEDLARKQPPPDLAAKGRRRRAVEFLDSIASGSSKAPKRTAIEIAADKVDSLAQEKLTQQTIAKMTEAQLSLFDVAPWSDDMRAMPNDYARSALFTVRNKRTPRAALQGKFIFHLAQDVSLHYTGIELRADDDELVWQQVLEYAKRAPMGEPCYFTFYQLCNDLGWSINGRYYKKAEDCLDRLKATSMRVSSPRIGMIDAVSLIHRFSILDHGTRASRCRVEIDPQMIVLFAGDHYSKFVWEKYRSLSPTSRRLFDYFVSHKQPFPLSLENFRSLCGSDSERTKKWREQTKHACEELVASGLIEKSWVNEDKIFCLR